MSVRSSRPALSLIAADVLVAAFGVARRELFAGVGGLACRSLYERIQLALRLLVGGPHLIVQLLSGGEVHRAVKQGIARGYVAYAAHRFVNHHDALDYVVKPVRKERLARAIERARLRLEARSAANSWDAASLAQMGNAVGYQPSRPARLLVRHGSGHRLTAVRDIIRFAAADGVVYAHTVAGSPIIDYTLADLEARLGPQFLRVSRADLVNVAHALRITSNGDGSATIEVTGGAAIHVSRRRAGEVWRALER